MLLPMPPPSCHYRVSVKALVVKNNAILLLQEEDGRWELPGGGLEFGETIEECLKREVQEEIGVTVKAMDPKPLYVWTVKKDEEGDYRLFLAYTVVLNSLDFKKSKEAIDFQFLSKKEMEGMKLHPNIQALPNFLNPKDF